MKKLSVTSNKNGLGNEAVSPVVGVMLMLVVTIIIAGVVSAFAGGLTDSTDKAPQVMLKGTYSQTDGLTISHQGGDAVGVADTDVYIRLSNTFGDTEHMAWKVNATTLVSQRGGKVGNSTAWLRDEGYAGIKSFVAGDNAYIEPPYHLPNFLTPNAGTTYYFNTSVNVGKTFWVELADKSGKTFAKTEVVIAP